MRYDLHEADGVGVANRIWVEAGFRLHDAEDEAFVDAVTLGGFAN